MMRSIIDFCFEFIVSRIYEEKNYVKLPKYYLLKLKSTNENVIGNLNFLKKLLKM